MSDKRAPRRPAPEPGRMAAKVPQIMQMEALECGAASLAMVCAYWGKWLPLEQVRLDCGVSRDGSSALNLVKAARAYGFEAKGFRYELEAMRERATFPCIVHWNFNHFVVVRGFKGDHAYLNDPAQGEIRLSMQEFDDAFTGVCLQFDPTSAFEPGGAPASIKSFMTDRLRGAGSTLAFLAVASAAVAVINAMLPVFPQFLVDHLLGGANRGWVVPFAAVLAVLGVVQAIVLFLNARYLLQLEGKLAVTSNSSFMWKLLHLPMEFFSQRNAGDLSSRLASNATVAHQLLATLAPIAINLVMLAVYLVVMVGYSPLLALIGVASVVLNLSVAVYISRKRVNIVRVQMRDRAGLDSATVTGIDMIETIKATGAEDGYFQRWSGFQAGSSNQQVSYVALDAYQGSIPRFISAAADVAVLMLGVRLVLDGQFTVGMVLAFQGFMQRFAAPAEELIASMQTFFEMRTDMERIQDVMKYEEDPLASGGQEPDAEEDEPAAPEAPADPDEDSRIAAAMAALAALDGGGTGSDYEKLHGEVVMEHVTFGYSHLAEPLIQDFSLHVKPGASIALVGPSGCGKSTIAKLISGLYRPWEGEVLLGGKPLPDIPRPVRTGSVAVVDQDIVLFEDTIDANIRLWDDSIEDYEAILAARDAQLHDDIMARPGGYQARLSEGGSNLSGGQRQRLEIARALAADPTVLVLDEATSALDAVTEHEVMARIRRRGITLVVVAHRLSTIRDCDEIIVLDHGRVLQRGTHEQLWGTGGLYDALVTQE